MSDQQRHRYAVTYYNRGLAYFKKGDFDSACKDFEKVIGLDPNNTTSSLARQGLEIIEAFQNVLGPRTIEVTFGQRENKYLQRKALLQKQYNMALWVIGFIVFAVILVAACVAIKILSVDLTYEKYLIVASAAFLSLPWLCLPLFLWLKSLSREIRITQVCVEDYFRKRILLTHALLHPFGSLARTELIQQTHAHFSEKSAAEFIAQMDAKTKTSDLHPIVSLLLDERRKASNKKLQSEES